MSYTTDENTGMRDPAFYFDKMAKPLLASAKVYVNDVKEMSKTACKELGKFLQNLNSDTLNLENLLDCNDQFSYVTTAIEKMEQTYSELDNAFSDNMTETQYSAFISLYNIIVSDYALACTAQNKLMSKLVK